MHAAWSVGAAAVVTVAAAAVTARAPDQWWKGVQINASLSRTGTASMAEALAILLDAPSYHCHRRRLRRRRVIDGFRQRSRLH